MITSSPTFKVGWCIASSPSNSILIKRGIPRTIAAVHCRSVTGWLRLHFNCLGCPKVRSSWGKFISTGLALPLLSCLLKPWLCENMKAQKQWLKGLSCMPVLNTFNPERSEEPLPLASCHESSPRPVQYSWLRQFQTSSPGSRWVIDSHEFLSLSH
uniref:Uncharacterized protein n=1 Tax=Hyaloperonospora arabidopsidis (strain Emoy2) TaxID=559515 RepID=M4C3U4_HYAAE